MGLALMLQRRLISNLLLIPPKYGDIETSGLTLEISQGVQVHDIALD
jgi:hypothetical protein